MSEIPVLDHGFVRLDDSMADDLSVVNSARVSFATRADLHSTWCPAIDGNACECLVENPHTHDIDGHKRLTKRDAGLIRFLMANRHGTPFEHNSFRFHIKAPLFVFREWQRHRISSYNEWSARYSKMEPEFYIPAPHHVRTQTGKPGAYTFERADSAIAQSFIRTLQSESELAFQHYENYIESGIAKEQARLFLPVNIYSQMYWTVNARSLMNFLSLRNSEQAMWEIREYARVVEQIFSELMPGTAKAFVQNNRTAP